MNNKVDAVLPPAGAFVLIFVVHFVWLGLFPEQDPAQTVWATLPATKSWLQTYLETGSFWLGYSYALSFAFAVAAVRHYLASRCWADKRFALGGVTFAGTLAIVGCFLVGCCGSPMLVFWLNLFGATFLPFAKPALAGITTATIGLAWWWMVKKSNYEKVQPTTGIVQHE
jgi:hypothetical protein